MEYCFHSTMYGYTPQLLDQQLQYVIPDVHYDVLKIKYRAFICSVTTNHHLKNKVPNVNLILVTISHRQPRLNQGRWKKGTKYQKLSSEEFKALSAEAKKTCKEFTQTWNGANQYQGTPDKCATQDCSPFSANRGLILVLKCSILVYTLMSKCSIGKYTDKENVLFPSLPRNLRVGIFGHPKGKQT